MPEHHGGRGGNVELMRSGHYIQPFLCTAFSVAHKPAHAVYEDLSTCTRKGIHAGFLECGKHLVVGHFFQLGNMCHFRGAKGM